MPVLNLREISPRMLNPSKIRVKQLPKRKPGLTPSKGEARVCLFRPAAAGAAVFGFDAGFVFAGEEGVHRELDLAENVAGALGARAADRRAGLRRNAVVERRDEQLRVALEPDDGELPDGHEQPLAFAGQHQRLVEAAQQRLGDGGSGLALAAAAARLHHARAEDDRVDRLGNGPRQRDRLQRLFAEARQIVLAREDPGAGLAAEQHQPLREDRQARDRIRPPGRERRVGDDAVVEGNVDRKVAGGVGDTLHLNIDKQQLHEPRLRARRAVQRVLGVHR